MAPLMGQIRVMKISLGDWKMSISNIALIFRDILRERDVAIDPDWDDLFIIDLGINHIPEYSSISACFHETNRSNKLVDAISTKQRIKLDYEWVRSTQSTWEQLFNYRAGFMDAFTKAGFHKDDAYLVAKDRYPQVSLSVIEEVQEIVNVRKQQGID